MAWPKGKPRPAGAGRKKGTPNALSGMVKDNIAQVFNDLGGVPEMVAWAKGNRDAFYATVYPRLLPHEIANADGQAFRVIALEKVDSDA